MISAALVLAATLSAPEALVQKFCTLKNETWGLLVGRDRKRLAPMLSKRLLAHADSFAACQRDWIRQQPKDTTDKPPFVDCCLFSGIPDGPPTSFRLESSSRLDDGRFEVIVELRLDTRVDHLAWRDAYLVVRENGRWVIDDIRRDVDDENFLVSTPDESCRDGKWLPDVPH